MKLKTGVTLLDDMLRGGLETGATTLVTSKPFTEATPLAYQIAYRWLNTGYPVIYLTNNKRPDIIMEDVKRYGWNLVKFKDEGMLVFVDAYTGFMGIKSKERYAVLNPYNLDEIDGTLLKAVNDVGKRSLIIIDSLSTMLDHFGEIVVEKFEEWRRIAILNDSHILYIFVEWDFEEGIKRRLRDRVDNIISLSPIEKGVILSDFFTIEKVGGKPIKPISIPFRYVRPGGMKVYIPKILITGPYHAGKTTVVHALSTRAVSVQRGETTVALDFGHFEHKGFQADLFGTIGQQRFDPILEQLGGETLGVILVVDSTDPSSFPRAIEMLHKARVYGLPLVVFANKQDLPEALPPEKVRELMKLPKDVPVIGTIATKKVNIIEGIEELLKLIFKGVSGGNVNDS